jgi:hypothetical protein
MTTDNYNYEINKEPSRITRFLWWCAGADEYFLRKSPKQDRVKYAGIGGIVLCTGLLAAVSGAFAFNTIFGPKGDAIDESLISSTGHVLGVFIFGIVWGLIIFNLDRFIISSTGKGDGSDSITGKEWLQALPRIIIAVILGFAISAPLEIKILESEINSELSKYQQEYTEKLNITTDIVFKQKLSKLEKDKKEYEVKLTGYEREMKVFDDQIDDLVARQQGEMQDKRAYGFGPVAKKMQMDIDTKRAEKAKFISLKTNEVNAWRKQLNFNDDQINKMSDDLRKAYKDNETKAHGYDGLLKRIQISHEIGGLVPWLILAVFLCIEAGPIIFKMMLTKGAYDYMVENNNHRMNMENGIFKEDVIYEAKDGIIHMEKYRYLEVESTKLEKERKIAEQDKINEEVINQWGKLKIDAVKKDPSKFITEGNESITNNNA